MTDDTIKADVVRRFHTIPGLGLTKAEVLYDSGYTTMASLKRATVEELSSVKGITPSMARYILREVQGLADDAHAPPAIPKDEAAGGADQTVTDDGETASISVSDQVKAEPKEAGAGSEGEDDEGGPEEGSAEESPGLFSGIIKSIKSLFGGGGADTKGAEEEPVIEEPVVDEVDMPVIEEKEDEPAVEEPEAEAQITVDHGPEKEKVEEKAGTQVETVEDGPVEEGSEGPVDTEPEPAPEPEPEEKGIVSDIKARGLARIKALRARISGKKKDEPSPEEETAEVKEEEEETAEEETAEAKEEKVEDKRPKKGTKAPPKGTEKKGDQDLVDNIIKELDLDGEES